MSNKYLIETTQKENSIKVCCDNIVRKSEYVVELDGVEVALAYPITRIINLSLEYDFAGNYVTMDTTQGKRECLSESDIREIMHCTADASRTDVYLDIAYMDAINHCNVNTAYLIRKLSTSPLKNHPYVIRICVSTTGKERVEKLANFYSRFAR